MLLQQNMHEAKTNLSKLVVRVLAGDRVVIARAHRPVVELVPFVERPSCRMPGSAKGQIVVSDDFDAPLPEEVLESFEA